VLGAAGYESLVLMSMLKPEYDAITARGRSTA